MSEVKQVIVMRHDLHMRFGKGVAQGAHASLAAYKKADKKMVKVWEDTGYAKVCVRVESEEELLSIYNKALEHKLTVALITDSGRTEFNGVATKTCLCIGPNYNEAIDKITGKLKLL